MSNESFQKFEIVASNRKKAHKILTQTQDTNFGDKLIKAARKRKNLSMSSKTLILIFFKLSGISLVNLLYVPHGCGHLSNNK